MRGQLTGKVALITGGTRGLGAATARRFVEERAIVAIVGRDKMLANQFTASLRASTRVAFLKADARETDAAGVADRFGRLDILINSAVSIINISSVSGQRGSTLRAAYGMARCATVHLTRVTAGELAPHGTRANAIAPGSIETRAATERHLPTTRGAYLRAISIRHYRSPEGVASTAMFLASDAASYVTGHVLNVDGGFCAAGIMEQELTAHMSAEKKIKSQGGSACDSVLPTKR